MNHILICLLTLLFSLSGSAIGDYSDFGQSSLAAKRGPKPSSPGKMQKEVERGQAPKDVDRVERGHVEGQEPHVHYKDGTSSTQTGGVHDAHKGQPNPPKKTKEWLEEHNWIPPKKGN